MPRILRILNRFNLGGPTHNAAYLTRYLPGEYETLLVGGVQEEHEEDSLHILRDLGIEPLVLPELRREVAPWRDRGAYRRIMRLIREFKPDIVHTHAAKAGAVGRMAAADAGVKVVVHTFHGHVFHSYFGPVRTALYKQVERYLARRSSRIIAISEGQKRELVEDHRICPPDKVSVVPLGFDLARFRQDQEAKRALFRQVYGLREGDVAVGIVGRLVPVKNHALFLRALARAEALTGKRIRAFVVGDGEDRTALERLTDQLGLSRTAGPVFNGHGFGHVKDGVAVSPGVSVTFTSWIKEVDIVYAGLDVVVLTSLNEGTPVSLIEAQAANKPVLSTRVGGIENVVVPDTTALLRESGDMEGLATDLARMVEDHALRQRLGKEGWAHVGQRYHYGRLVDDMACLYAELLNEAPR